MRFWNDSKPAHMNLREDQRFWEYVLEGLEHRFRVGLRYSRVSCKSAKRNMLSAKEHPEVVERYLVKE